MNPVSDASIVLTLSGIKKSYGETRALRGIDLDVKAGEILGIAGPNGAGKSTLVRILAGDEPRDAGDIRLSGSNWEPGDRSDPVAVVHQEPQVWVNLSLAENVIVGRETFRFGRPRLTDDERRILVDLGIDEYADLPLGQCSLAIRQRAEIARALARRARFFLFDEPNSALTEEQSDRLFVYMHDLADRGKIVVLISHRLAELVAHCARVAVIRDGRVTADFSGSTLTQESIARELVVEAATVGERSPAVYTTLSQSDQSALGHSRSSIASSAPSAALSLRAWSHPDGRFRGIELDIACGEIVAAIGVEGSGARELVASTAGFELGFGHRAIGGSEREDAASTGSVFLPADRRAALFANLSVAGNLAIRLGRPDIANSAGFLRLAPMRTLCAATVQRFGVRASSPDAPIVSLSGGNQQKVAIAAAITCRPGLLVLEEPTRGVDVGAKREIYAILRAFAAAGGGVLVFCTEVPEVFELATRAIIVDRGRISRDIRVSDFPDVSTLAAAIARSEHIDAAVPAIPTTEPPTLRANGGHGDD